MSKSAKIAPHKGEKVRMHLVEAAAARRIVYLEKAEVERLFEAIPHENTRDRLLFDVLYRHGLRRSEAVLLRRDLHLTGGRIRITRRKGGVSGEYPIHPVTRRLLWTYLTERREDANPYFFPSRQSGVLPMSASLVYALFRQYADAASIPRERQHPHVLRHSIAVHLMNALSGVN